MLVASALCFYSSDGRGGGGGRAKRGEGKGEEARGQKKKKGRGEETDSGMGFTNFIACSGELNIPSSNIQIALGFRQEIFY